MGKSIYVGNLPFSATVDEIRTMFEQYGAVESVQMIRDQQTGRPRGFAFVEMEAKAAAVAIRALDGQPFGDRNLRINEAQPRREGRQGW